MTALIRLYKPLSIMGLFWIASSSTGAFGLDFKDLSPAAQALVEKDNGTGAVQLKDIIIMKNGDQHVGELKASDDPSVVSIKERSSTGNYAISEISKIKMKLTPEIKLENIVEANKDNIRVMIEKLRDYEKETRGLDEKISPKLEALATSNPNLDLFLFMAERYIALGKPDRAESMARKAVEKDTRSAQGWYLLGKSLNKMGKGAEATQALNKALELDPTNEKIRVEITQVPTPAGGSSDARKSLEDIIARNPQQVDAWVSLGKLLLQDGEIEAAGQKYEQALKIDEKKLQAIIGLAACKMLTKDYDAGYKIADKISLFDYRVEDLRPRANELQAYAKLMTPEMELAAMEANVNKAMDKIQQAVRDELNDPRFKVLQYRILMRAADIAEKLGKANDVTARKEDAARVLADLEALDPAKLTDNVVLFWLSERQYRRGDHEKALPGLKRLTQVSPNYALGHQALGSCLLKLRKWNEAAQSFEKALSLDQTLADAQAGIGLAMLGRKELSGAKEKLKNALDLDSQCVPALCGMGYIANSESNEMGARALFHQALAIDGNCKYAADALKKMYEQRELVFQCLDFDDPTSPASTGLSPGSPNSWAAKGSVPLRPQFANGGLNWSGVAVVVGPGQKYEYFCPLMAEGFKRVEADLSIPASSGASLALRVASRTGSATTFEIEFGKDPNSKIAYRVRDYNGAAMDWKQLPKPMDWPESGKVRLAIESAALTRGDITLYVNGKNVGQMTLNVKNPTRIAAGVFLQPAPNEGVDAYADNVAVLYKKGADRNPVMQGGTELKAPEEGDKPADDKGGAGAK